MFTLALIVIIVLILSSVYPFMLYTKYREQYNAVNGSSRELMEKRDDAFGSGVFCVVPAVIFSIVCVLTFTATAHHYVTQTSKYKNQVLIVEVQQQRIQRLKASLDKTYKVAGKRDLLFNNDSPIKSLIDQLAEAEKSLAEAKMEKILAKNYIDSVKNGQMWLVHKVYGD